MFGYIKPFDEELKVKHVKAYRNVYCAVCNALKKRYGFFYSFVLNYEVVFLYIYLAALECSYKNDYKITCIINPLRKVTYRVNTELLYYVAFVNVYLAQGKLKDDYMDEHKVICKVLFHVFNISGNYRRECKKYSELINSIDECLGKLNELENANISDIDECSETMGNILKKIVSFYFDFYNIKVEKRTEAEEIAFILGQWIYVADAYDDFEKDKVKGSFNPFINQNIDNHKDVGIKLLNLMSWDINRIKGEITFKEYDEIIDNVFKYGLQKKAYEISKKGNKTFFQIIKEKYIHGWRIHN